MRPKHCHTILHMSILAALLLTLDAESEDFDCAPGIKVRRNTVYDALLGGDLRINCSITFCNNSPPTVSWYKIEKDVVPVNFNRSTRIKTEWKMSNDLEGTSFMIFQNIQRSDSGQYHCRYRDEVSHSINVSIYDNGELPKDTCKNETSKKTHSINVSIYESTTTQDTLWPYVYRAAGVVVFVIIVITIHVYAASKGVHYARKSKNTPDPSPQPLPRGSPANQHVLPSIHTYENDPNDPVYNNC